MMAASTAIWAAAVLLGAFVSQPSVATAAEANNRDPCPDGSLPYDKCDFSNSAAWNACWNSVNTGQSAKSTGVCEVPTSYSRCAMQWNGRAKYWEWKATGANCCNCFAKRATSQPTCPSGSLPADQCDFNNPNAVNACLSGVNYGAMALPTRYCEPPSARNGCVLKYENRRKRWEWQSNKVSCCNCYSLRWASSSPWSQSAPSQQASGSTWAAAGQVEEGVAQAGDARYRPYDREDYGYDRDSQYQYDDGGAWALAQTHDAAQGSAEARTAKRRLRHSMAGGDASSMLQVSVDQDDVEAEGEPGVAAAAGEL